MIKNECTYVGCETKIYAKAYCRSHYEKNRRWGTPDGAPERVKPDCACGQPSHTKGMCKRCYSRFWRENAVATAVKERATERTYENAHYRLTRELGYAGLFTCVDCGNQASEWSLRHDAVYVIEDKNSRLFSTYNNDYQPRCHADHRAYDAKFGMRKYTTGKHAGTGVRPDYSPNLQGEPHRVAFTGTPAVRFTDRTYRKDSAGRECTGCDTYKPWDDFYDSGRGAKQARCIECVREYQREMTAARKAVAA